MPITNPTPTHSGVHELEQIHRTMGNHDHISGRMVGFGAKGGRSQVSNGNLFHWQQMHDAVGFSHGYGGVRDRIAKSVGGRKADQIMENVLGKGKTGRTRGWKSLFMPRNKGITKDQLGKILKATYKEMSDQFSRYDENEGKAAVKTMSKAKLQNVIRNPKLEPYLRAHLTTEFSIENLDFLQECNRYDQTVSDAEKIRESLLDDNKKLVDDAGNEVKMGDAGHFVRASDGGPVVGTRLQPLEQAITRVRVHANAVYQQFIHVGAEQEVNLSYHTRNVLTNANVNTMSLDGLKKLYGSGEPNDDQKTITTEQIKARSRSGKGRAKAGAAEKTTDARGEIFSLMTDSFNRLKKKLNPREFKPDPTYKGFSAINNEMKPGDHLRSTAGKKARVYIKSDSNVRKNNPTFTTRRGAHLINFLTQPFSWNNRLNKMNRSKRQLRNAMANHLGSQAAANRIVNKHCGNAYKAITDEQLDSVLAFGRMKETIDSTLTSMENNNRLSELNQATGDDVYNAWIGRQPTDVSDLVLDHTKIYSPGLERNVKSLSNCAEQLNTLQQTMTNSNNVTKDKGVASRLKRAKANANWALKWGRGLTPKDRVLLKRVSNLKQKHLSKAENVQLLQSASTALDNAGKRVCAGLLHRFRNEPGIAARIGGQGLPNAIADCDNNEIDNMSDADLLDPSSKANKAFKLYCQSNGQYAERAATIKKFSDDLTNHFNGTSDHTSIAELRHQARQVIKDRSVNIQPSDDPVNSSISKYTPTEILNRIAKNKTFSKNDALVLSAALQKDVDHHIDTFKEAAPSIPLPVPVSVSNDDAGNINRNDNVAIQSSIGSNNNNDSIPLRRPSVNNDPLMNGIQPGPSSDDLAMAFNVLTYAGASQQEVEAWADNNLLDNDTLQLISNWQNQGRNANPHVPGDLVEQLRDRYNDLSNQNDGRNVEEEEVNQTA